MKTARERANELWNKLIDESEEKSDWEMITFIENAIKSAAKDQRDAIALKIDDETHGCNIGLEGKYAYHIAVNTCAV